MWPWISEIINILRPYFQFPDIISHVIDIIVIAFILYQLLLLIKQTRAEQVLKGLAILFFTYFISKWLRLNGLSWIMENTIQFGVIAGIIVFQPELRRALEQIGRGKIFEKAVLIGDENDPSAIIDEIVDAVENMAKTKTGALIVIERKTGINDIIETGIIIDAQLTSELLENLFVPNTPLHDGAVVIREDRIAAAGCFLPLTENPNLSKKLGTRHRAGIGISESSDALSIIVSEETGVVSLASEGKLTRYLDKKGLKDILKKAYGIEYQGKYFNFKRWRSKNG